jgi:hypothetical protein
VNTLSGSARVTPRGVELSILVPISADPEPVGGIGPQSPSGRAWHSPDFARVRWEGAEFSFTSRQRLVVAALWSAHADGHEWVSHESLLIVAEYGGSQLRDVFNHGRHPAWGTMIVAANPYGGPLGSFRLGVPGRSV